MKNNRFRTKPIALVIIPAVDTPVGRVPSLLDLEMIPNISPSIDGINVQQLQMPTMPKIREAIANPSV